MACCIDADRAAALRAQGFTVTTDNAITKEPPTVDVVVANPPFSPQHDLVYEVQGVTTRQRDHAISLQATKSFTENGVAVLNHCNTRLESRGVRQKAGLRTARISRVLRAYL